jgi:hypothetical protein
MAALAKRAGVKTNAPKAKQVEPSAKQESLRPGWNNVVSGGRIIKADIPPNPKPVPPQSLKVQLGVK